MTFFRESQLSLRSIVFSNFLANAATGPPFKAPPDVELVAQPPNVLVANASLVARRCARPSTPTAAEAQSHRQHAGQRITAAHHRGSDAGRPGPRAHACALQGRRAGRHRSPGRRDQPGAGGRAARPAAHQERQAAAAGRDATRPLLSAARRADDGASGRRDGRRRSRDLVRPNGPRAHAGPHCKRWSRPRSHGWPRPRSRRA